MYSRGYNHAGSHRLTLIYERCAISSSLLSRETTVLYIIMCPCARNLPCHELRDGLRLYGRPYAPVGSYLRQPRRAYSNIDTSSPESCGMMCHAW